MVSYLCFNIFTWERYPYPMKMKFGDIYIAYVSYNKNGFNSNILKLINILWKTILNIGLIPFNIIYNILGHFGKYLGILAYPLWFAVIYFIEFIAYIHYSNINEFIEKYSV
jgi:hypothetical protein